MADMDLGKQIGPLPLGAWIAVVAGGLGIALWSRNRDSGEVEIVEDTSGDPGVGEGPGTPGFIPINPPNQTPGDNVTENYNTNEEWGRAAIEYLIAQGHPAAIANSAITKALAGGEINGAKMSAQEWSLWSIALKKLGPPPTPVNVPPPTTGVPGPVIPPPPPPIKKPVPKPVPKPPVTTKPPTAVITKPTLPKPGGTPRYRTIVILPGQSLSTAVAAYNRRYGTRVSWQTVWDFNLRYRPASTVRTLKSRGPNKVFAGSRFWVPY